MDDVKVLGIKESSIVGRWVLAHIRRYDGSECYEVTLAPDLGSDEWADIAKHLPPPMSVRALQGVTGEMLGRRHALMATFQ